jgi:hypothetical protein
MPQHPHPDIALAQAHGVPLHRIRLDYRGDPWINGAPAWACFTEGEEPPEGGLEESLALDALCTCPRQPDGLRQFVTFTHTDTGVRESVALVDLDCPEHGIPHAEEAPA